MVIQNSMTYLEEDLLSISYLNDLLFCERRAALHLLEGIWRDNQYTVEGSFAHRNVDVEANRKRGDKQNVTGMWVVSYRLGLIGKCDLVEMRTSETVHAERTKGTGGTKDAGGTPAVLGARASRPHAVRPQLATLYPVDFKRGKRRRWDNNEVQLCAQALCLEEMLHVDVPKGAIFHIKSQHREEVEFTPALRQKTENAVEQLRNILQNQTTPKAKFAPKCSGCSLLEWCLPKSLRPRATATAYLNSILDS